MIYLFLGQDNAAKEVKVNELKKKILSPPEALKFDYEILYAQKLEPETFKKALIALPAIAKQRLVVLKEGHKLSTQNKELVLAFAKDPGPCVLIIDSDKTETEESLVKKLGSAAKVVSFKTQTPLNVFNLTRAIATRKSAESLKILSALLAQGEQPLSIMGGLIWYWKNARREFSLEVFKKGLLSLQEADLNIKRSRLKPEHALELLVVKLCSPEAG